MATPKFYIDEDNYNRLIGPGCWQIQDLPSERAELVKPFLNNATLAVFASGCPPQQHSGYGNSIPGRTYSADADEDIAGIDWVRLEGNPKHGEPPLNVYHFVIKKPDQNGYPVYACQNGKSIAPHWSEWVDLSVYSPEGDDTLGR